MPLEVQAKEGRFARLEAIEWWDQALLARAKVLVIGAGALGNEVIKNLALLGVGHVVVADQDRVELSNLSRSVLFRESDEGQPKAKCAVRAAREIFPGADVRAFVGNVLSDMGLGYFCWADAVIGALDNREARIFVNAACARTGRTWFDGGIEVLHGVARGFAPPATACYECTMSKVDWELLNHRRSCSLLARRATAQRGTPTTPTTAAIIAAIQVQELVKHLHGRPALLGRGIVYDGAEHASFKVSYPISPDCPWHETPVPIERMLQFNSDTPLRVIWKEAATRLGGLDAIDFSRELVERVDCSKCGWHASVWQPADHLTADQLYCPHCRVECAPKFRHALNADDESLDKSMRGHGLPSWDVVWVRKGEEIFGWEIGGDNPFAVEPKTGLNPNA